MKQMTLRGIPAEIERMIKREAEREGLSLNKAFISFLERSTGTKKKAQKRNFLHHDLDHLCGIWTKREAEEFMKQIELQRTIDEDSWVKGLGDQQALSGSCPDHH